jgi:hypothetical protein
MFAGIDIASESHMLARLDAAGAPIGRPIAIAEDHAGYDTLLAALGPPPALIVMEATGHYWKNLFAVLNAAGHDVVLLNPFTARRFQEASLDPLRPDAGVVDRGLPEHAGGLGGVRVEPVAGDHPDAVVAPVRRRASLIAHRVPPPGRCRGTRT